MLAVFGLLFGARYGGQGLAIEIDGDTGQSLALAHEWRLPMAGVISFLHTNRVAHSSFCEVCISMLSHLYARNHID